MSWCAEQSDSQMIMIVRSKFQLPEWRRVKTACTIENEMKLKLSRIKLFYFSFISIVRTA